MDEIKTILAIIVVVAIGFFFLKKITSCLIRIVITVVLLAILCGALRYLGMI